MISEMDAQKVYDFAQSMVDVKDKLTRCRICGNLSDQEECEICRNPDRSHTQIFVVQSPKDVIAMEKAGQYRGVYHVLNGVISPSKGILPEDLDIDSLVQRAADAQEVILATSNTMDGETTAMYLDRLLKQQYPDLLVTRIAHGLPAGGLLDYADEMTLAYALSNRSRMK